MKVTPHFTVEEFACHTGKPYPAKWIKPRLKPLCEMLEAVRGVWGGPLFIVSGYRSPAYNERLRSKSTGVAKNSQHVQGRAADFLPIHVTTGAVEDLCCLIADMLGYGELPLVGGFGRYRGWAHLDVRPKPSSGHVARWDGAGFGSEPIG